MEKDEEKRKKNYRFISFLPDACYKIQKKNSEKIQKIKKYHYGYISGRNRKEKDEKKRNKNYRSISFQPDV